MASEEKLSKMPTESPTSINSIQAESVGRRELLKALTSGSGAVALSQFVPNTWALPVIETGIVPVHAQTSGLTIANLQVEGPLLNNQSFEPTDIFGRSAPNVNGGNSGVVSFLYRASLTYNDPLGLVNSGTAIHIAERYKPSNSIIADSTSLGTISANISGDGFSGTIDIERYRSRRVEVTTEINELEAKLYSATEMTDLISVIDRMKRTFNQINSASPKTKKALVNSVIKRIDVAGKVPVNFEPKPWAKPFF